MDGNNFEEFNELGSLAQNLLSKVDNELERAKDERDAAQRQFGEVSHELDDLKIKYAETTQELIDVRKQRDELRGDISDLKSAYRILADNFRKTQLDLSNTKTELSALREKVAQARRYLAG